MDWITNLRDKAPGMRPAPAAAARPWYSIRNAAGGETAEVLLYDEIGGWWGTLAEDLVAELRAITAPNILVRVNSPGGSVFDGISIANALRAHPAAVTVQVDGLAASIASVIALAGDRLVMAPNSMLMIHEASGGCLGNAADMEQMASLLDKISDNIASAYADKAGGTAADWRALMLAETWYTAAEAVEAGLADEVTPARAAAEDDDGDGDGGDDPTVRASWDLSVFRYAGREQAPAPVPVAAQAQRPATAAGPAATAATPQTAPPGPEARPAPGEPSPVASAEELDPDGPSTDPVTDPSPDPVNGPSTSVDAPSPADTVWAALVARITSTPSADDEFARLKEAML